MSRLGKGLPCPACGSFTSAVLERRAPWRRRQCVECHTRFSTTEIVTTGLPAGTTTHAESATMSATPEEKSSVDAAKTN